MVTSFVICGQEFHTFNFTNLTEANGLSHNTVYAICQDEKGYMWFGTENGLDRYDGKRIKSYYKNQKPFNLKYNLIHDLKYINNQMWILGLNNCDLYNNKFEKIDSLNYNQTCELALFNKDTFLVGFESLFSYKDNIGFAKVQAPSLKGKTYYKMIEYDEGTYLAFFQNKIDLLDSKTLHVKDSIFLDKRLAVQIMQKDKYGRVWLGTWDKGLFLLDVNTKKIRKFELGNENTNVTQLYLWKNQEREYLLAAVNNENGFVIIDLVNLKWKSLHDISTTKVKKPLFIYNFFEDDNRNLWIATSQGVMLHSNQNLFKIHAVQSPDKSRTIASQALKIKFYDDEIWTLKRYDDGLHIYDENWQLKYYADNIVSNAIYPFCNIENGFDMVKHGDYVYISGDCGFFKVHFKTKETRLIYHESGSFQGLRSIAEINDHEVFVKSRPNKLLRFDFKSDKFTKTYYLKDESGNNQIVADVIRSYDGKYIYAASENKVFIYSNKKDQFEPISNLSLDKYRIASLTDDGKGKLWISTYTGLLDFDLKTNKVIQEFTHEKDMSYVLNSVVDKESNIWFNCQKGYWCWLQDKQKMIKFGYDLGLPDNRVNGGITTSFDKSTIYAGAEDAIVEFLPSAIASYKPNKKALITSILVNNIETDYLENNIKKKELKLKSDERNLTIYFSVPDFSIGKNYEYYFQINESPWQKTDKAEISFNNLNQGDYSIKVKGRLVINNEETLQDELIFSIAAYWYESAWFKSLALLSLLSLLYLIYRWKINQIRNKDKIKSEYEKRLITLELANLRSQMNPHFIFNSLNSINSFIIDNETKLASDYLTKFSRLVRMILDNSKNETISLQKEVDTLSLYLLIEGLRFENKFTYQIIIDEKVNLDTIFLPPMIIQPFVENAIWHGILPKKSGHITIQISFCKESDDLLEVIIKDNGIGREKAIQLKTKSGSNDKSYGIDITQQRIKTLGNRSNVSIEDLFENGNATGTIIKLNLQYKNLEK